MTSTNVTVHDAIVAGEMVPQDIVMQLVEQQVLLNRDTDGIILSGFPRNFDQVDEFENKVLIQSHLIHSMETKITK